MAVNTRNSIVTDGLVLHLDAANPKSTPEEGFVESFRINESTSNGTYTLQQELLPNNTTGNCFKLANGTFTDTVTVQNRDFQCDGDSIMQVYIKPIEYFYVKLRDGGTTNLQVDFDLTNGTVVGGNNAINGSITSYPNGWFLLTMRINRTTPFNLGSRIAIYPDNTFSSYNSTVGSGVLVYMLTVKTNTLNKVKGLLNDINGRLVNGTIKDSNGFIFDGVNDYMNLDSNYIGENNFNEITLSTWITLNSEHTVTSTSSKIVFGGFLNINNRCILYFSTDSSFRGRLIFGSFQNNQLTTYFRTLRNNWDVGTYHIVFSVKSTGSKIYINGIEEPSEGTTSTPTHGYLVSSTTRYTLGAGFYNSLYNFLNAKIHNFSIYNRALSQQEILQNYNATKSRFNLL